MVSSSLSSSRDRFFIHFGERGIYLFLHVQHRMNACDIQVRFLLHPMVGLEHGVAFLQRYTGALGLILQLLMIYQRAVAI